MQNFIMTFFIVLLSITTLVINTDTSTYARSTKYVKEDLEIAVHDAGLQIDQTQYSKGLVVINPTKAMNTFIQSLQTNAKLSSTDYQILDFKIFDNSNTTFPITYTVNGTSFSTTINSPTVIAAIRVQASKYFNVFDDNTVTRLASYSYKIKNTSGTSNVTIVSPSSQGFIWAVPYTTNIVSPFTPQQVDPTTGKITWHKGVDISSDGVLNQSVVSVKDGKVTNTGVVDGYGNMVEITHSNGLVTRYGNLATIGVSNGQAVTAGQVIGTVGSSGESNTPHLHFETIQNGVYIDPVQFYK